MRGVRVRAMLLSGLVALTIAIRSSRASTTITPPASTSTESVLRGFQRHEQAFRDLQRQSEGLVNSFKGRLQKAKEMCKEKLLRKDGHDVEHLNEQLLQRVMEFLEEDESHGWEFVARRHGTTVHRKFMPPMSTTAVPSKFCCVKASGVLEASAQQVAELFEGNTRVSEYNKYFAEGRDLEFLSNATKVVWASSPAIFPFKARDYCTYVHYRKRPDGTIIVLNRVAIHPSAPVSNRYVRAEVLMGASIIQPVRGNPNKCVFTTIAHINPGGLIPPFLVNKLCAHGPVQFHNLVEKAAQRKIDKSQGDKYGPSSNPQTTITTV